tara:strand:+ start:269 stop:472 length:204 start_codon:yes stop_codon:yes gene_type:complete
MPIRRKSSLDKKYYEKIGQGLLFGHDNLLFKTVNLPKKQRLTNLCKKFSVKLINNTNRVFLRVIKLS